MLKQMQEGGSSKQSVRCGSVYKCESQMCVATRMTDFERQGMGVFHCACIPHTPYDRRSMTMALAPPPPLQMDAVPKVPSFC